MTAEGAEKMSYQLNLSLLSITDYMALLKNQNLLPSRRILKDHIDEHFSRLMAYGISDVEKLRKCLSSPSKMTELKEFTGIPQDYLVILKREIGSMLQKPVLLSQFPGINRELIEHLGSMGIRDSYEYYKNHQQTTDDQLYCLCDLVRINGIGPVAARMFYEAGYRSVALVSQAHPKTLSIEINKVNEIHSYYRGVLGEKDMQFCIEFAKILMAYPS